MSTFKVEDVPEHESCFSVQMHLVPDQLGRFTCHPDYANLPIVRIVPRSRELIQMNKQYGKQGWRVECRHGNVYSLSTVAKVHNNGTYSYSCWAQIGVDFSFELDKQ